MPELQPQSVTASEEVPADVRQLAEFIHSLPENFSEQILPVLDRVLESTKRRRRILTLVQDALGQLRLDMKYLMFDLEATRRERDEYKAKFENE